MENTAPSQEFLLQSGFRVYNHGDAITVKWGNATEADSYDVFAQYCGNKKFKKIKTVTGRKYTFKKLNSKKLDLTNCVKVYVVAMKSGQKIASTQTGHIACRKSKYTNVKRIIVPKATIKLKAGKTKKLKVSVRLENGGKKEIKAKDHHCSRFIYATSNKAVATVSKNGKIRAVAPGTCDIWIYAMNGVSKNVKVVVQ